MTYLFSKRGRERLVDLRPEASLLAFDFDGTIAPIGDDPNKARTVREFASPLRQLSRGYNTAIISGRGVGDLNKRIGFVPLYLVGNHGIEGIAHFRKREKAAQAVCRKWIDQLGSFAVEFGDEPGVFIENKAYSLSLHYRLARRKGAVERALRKKIASLRPAPKVVWGHDIFNLVPRSSVHKGLALRQLMRQSGARLALFVGDDTTDEDVFALGDKRVLSVRVGRKRGSAAEFYIRDLAEMRHLLNALIENMKEANPRRPK